MRPVVERIVLYLAIFLSISFWPFNFLLHNSLQDAIHFFLPGVLVAAAVLLGSKTQLGKLMPFFSPLINSSLLFAPLTSLLFVPKKRITIIIFITIIIVILTTAFKPFLGSSVFYYSWDDQQKIIQHGYLYPNLWMSRTFQNKPSIYFNRFLFNFFALVDPNNYFFGFHPREIAIDNQNLQKFPFLAIVLFLIGLYISVQKNRQLLLVLFLLIINLSLLKNFDKTDAVLWLPMFVVMFEGFTSFLKFSSKIKLAFFVLFFIFTGTEYLHLIINAAINL